MNITMKKLWRRLIYDLNELGLPIDEVDLYMRPYSKMYYGNYFPLELGKSKKPRIYVYPFSDLNGHVYPYEFLLDTTIHEMVHHLQYTSPNFRRVDGVMHNQEFWELYNKYMYKAKLIGVISDEYKSEEAA